MAYSGQEGTERVNGKNPDSSSFGHAARALEVLRGGVLEFDEHLLVSICHCLVRRVNEC